MTETEQWEGQSFDKYIFIEGQREGLSYEKERVMCRTELWEGWRVRSAGLCDGQSNEKSRAMRRTVWEGWNYENGYIYERTELWERLSYEKDRAMRRIENEKDRTLWRIESWEEQSYAKKGWRMRKIVWEGRGNKKDTAMKRKSAAWRARAMKLTKIADGYHHTPPYPGRAGRGGGRRQMADMGGCPIC
jgi:hypothetical protein